MKAIILAAGRGSRMKSLTDERPKCLVEFRGRPLLEWQLEALRSAGIRKIGVVRGYRGEMLEPYGLTMFENPRWAETQMVTSLACASEWLTREPCLACYSDLFYETDAIRLLVASDADLAITYDPNWLAKWSKRFDNPLDDAETFRIDANGRVLEIGNKPKTIEEVQGQYMGLLKFTPASWSAVEKLRSSMTAADCDRIHMTGTLQKLIEAGQHIQGVSVRSGWGEFDSDDDLAKAS